MEDIKDTVRDHWLGQFGHVTRRGEENLVRATMELKIAGKSGRGKSKLTWEWVVMTDMASYRRERERERRDLDRGQKGLKDCDSSTRTCHADQIRA